MNCEQCGHDGYFKVETFCRKWERIGAEPRALQILQVIICPCCQAMQTGLETRDIEANISYGQSQEKLSESQAEPMPQESLSLEDDEENETPRKAVRA